MTEPSGQAPIASTSTFSARFQHTLPHQNVLFRVTNGLVRAVKLTPGTTVQLGKLGKINVDRLTGLAYGTTYQLENDGGLVPAVVELQLDQDDDDTAATNEHIKSLGKQTLTEADIQALRDEGMEGRDIVLKQTALNSSFDQKTSYSKAKYIARKEAKYLKLLTPLSPTLPNICDYLHEKQGTSFPLAHALRSDALSQIMSYADIKPGSRCLLVDDTTSHLLTSALLSRMNGQGRIMLISDTDSDPAYVAMPLFNLTEEEKAPLRVLNWAMLQSEWAPDEAAVAEGEASLGAKAKARKDSKRKRVAELEVDRQDLLAGGFDALIIASAYDPCSILDQLTPRLAGSAQLVATSSILQPLSALQSYIRDSRDFIAPSLIEPTLRRYQVLAGRTHPDMNGMMHGGYVLHAIRIIASAEEFVRPPKAPKANGVKRKRDREEEATVEAS